MLTQSRLKELVNYNPQTGVFTWRISRRITSCKINVGDVAGFLTPDGYVYFSVDGRRYAAHRLAWLYMTGSWPSKLIDHEDLDRSNNIFLNLREATRSQNGQNRRMQSNNTSGYKGVYPSGKKFLGRIKNNSGKTVYLGTFKTAEEASLAVIEFSLEQHGDFFRY